jgi:hypothetical protein
MDPLPHSGFRTSTLTAFSLKNEHVGFIAAFDDPHQNPAFQKLVNALSFSRRLVASYNVVLVLLLLLTVSFHQFLRIRRSYRQSNLVKRALGETLEDPLKRQNSEENERRDEDIPSSDSSSTIAGTATPPDLKGIDEITNEQTALLPRHSRKRRSWRSTKSSFRAFLMYQPGSVPIINKRLPNNGTTFVVFAFYGLNLLYCVFNIPFEGLAIPVLADRFGMLFAANLPLLYLLAAKNQPIKRLTGYSYEALNIFHRRLGEVMCFFAFLHMAGMFLLWYAVLRPVLHVALWKFLSNSVVVLGLGAFISYELLYLTSIGSFRQRWYELFLASHVFLQLAAALFLWFHYPTSRLYVGAALLLFFIDRVVYRLLLKSENFEATITVMEDGETVLVSSNWAIQTRMTSQHHICTSIASGWRPTDHVFLSVPTFSWRDNLQAHPFTIASAAPNMSTPEPHAWLSLLIRAQDGFSRRLLDYAHQHATLRVRLDGPYGSSHPLETLRDSDLALVVAGGSGIAVAFPLIWALLEPLQSERDEGSAAIERLKQTRRTVCLVWVVHSRSHLSWLPQERVNELKEWGLELCIPPPTADGGRPDVAEIVQNLVYQHQECASSAIVVSGPDGMNRDVRNACSDLVQEGLDVRVTVEKFGW